MCNCPFIDAHVTRGLMIVPGLGRADRLNTVVANLKLLNAELNGKKYKWDCVVYVYAPRSDESFWSLKAGLEGRCALVGRQRKI